jgi:hypothetical protein
LILAFRGYTDGNAVPYPSFKCNAFTINITAYYTTSFDTAREMPNFGRFEANGNTHCFTGSETIESPTCNDTIMIARFFDETSEWTSTSVSDDECFIHRGIDFDTSKVNRAR